MAFYRLAQLSPKKVSESVLVLASCTEGPRSTNHTVMGSSRPPMPYVVMCCRGWTRSSVDISTRGVRLFPIDPRLDLRGIASPS